MQFTLALAAAAFVAGAAAHKNETGPVYVTEVVTAYTTYCPTPTEITHGGQTYTVTEATTLTITNCPCTITKPVESHPPYPSTVVVPPPVVTSKTVAPPPVGTPPVHGTPTATPVPPPTWTGAASRQMVGGAGAAAAFLGMAAYIL